MKTGMDGFLRDRAQQYDEWLKGKQIDFSARVIPVRESIPAKQWVLPMGQVLSILENAKSIALANCLCRSHYKRCDHPVNVCLLLNDYGEKFVARDSARPVSHAAAAEVVKTANKRGLVHLSLYRPDHRLYALCSCCPCCCHDLQLLFSFKRRDLVVHSDYVAVVDPDECIHCGACVDRCVFGARVWHGERVAGEPAACYGCGLCVTACPAGAISMAPRTDKG